MTRNLLLSGGPGHDFEATNELLVGLLAEHGITSLVLHDPDEAFAALRRSEDDRSEFFSMVTVNALAWSMEADRFEHQRERDAYRVERRDLELVDRFVRNGGGLLALHTAVICFDGHPLWRDLCGVSWNWEMSSHPPCGVADVALTAQGRAHPLTLGIDDFSIDDEIYGFLDLTDVVPLLTSAHGGRDHPVLWAREVGLGRVVTDLLGHHPPSIEHPVHREVLARSAAWLVRQPEEP